MQFLLVQYTLPYKCWLGMQAGIRIIITLTNHWPEFGGIGWYVDNTIAPGRAHELFYTDGRAIAAYQTWVRH